MAGPTLSSAGLEPRVKRILYRSWHRGMRELDMLIGSFAEARLTGMSAAELDQFEALLDVPDPDMLAWLTGMAPVPPQFDTPLFHALRDSQQGAAS